MKIIYPPPDTHPAYYTDDTEVRSMQWAFSFKEWRNKSIEQSLAYGNSEIHMLPVLWRKVPVLLPGNDSLKFWSPSWKLLATPSKLSYFHNVLAWVSITKYHRLDGLNNRFIFHSSEGWKSEIRVPAWSGSGGDPLLGCRLLPHSKKEGVSFVRALIPFMRALPSWPNNLPNALPFHMAPSHYG